MGIFLILIHIDYKIIDIAHHITPGSRNILIKISSNYKAILGLKESSTIVETKDNKNKNFSKDKVIKL